MKIKHPRVPTFEFEIGIEYCIVFERNTLRAMALRHPDEVLFRGRDGHDLKGQAAADYIDSLPPERRYLGCRQPVDATGMCNGHPVEEGR